MLDPAARYGRVDAVQGNEVAIGEEGIEDESDDPANGMFRIEIWSTPNKHAPKIEDRRNIPSASSTRTRNLTNCKISVLERV